MAYNQLAETATAQLKPALTQNITNLAPTDDQYTKMTMFNTKTMSVRGTAKTVTIINEVAFLPMPQTINVDYPKEWSAGATMDMSQGMAQTAKDEAYRGLYKTVDALATDRMMNEARWKYGGTLNDKMKMLFDNIPFRTFSFPLLFQPKSQAENALIHAWINTVKLKSAPSYLEGQAFFKFPDFIKLEWPRLNKLFTTGALACTNVSVNYTPNGIWSQHTDGLPTAVSVNLSFTEVELATKENIVRGF